MIGLVHKWIANGTEKYVPPLRLITRNQPDPIIEEWTKASIDWGVIALNQEGYIDYQFFSTTENVSYAISYYMTRENLENLRNRPEYQSFLDARSTYMEFMMFDLEEKIIDFPSDEKVKTVEELIELFNSN